MKINVSCGSKQLILDIGEDLSNLGQFRSVISSNNDLDPNIMKLLHRGKLIQGDDSEPLDKFGFKDNDKVIVMGGRKMAIKDDPGFTSLVQYEKQNLCTLQKNLDEIQKDLGELEKNFLEEKMQRDLAKKLDKRIKCFNEISERHLEALDGMSIIRDETPEAQAQRNREKRKGLIGGIQTLLNQNDAFSRRLEEYLKKLNSEIVE